MPDALQVIFFAVAALITVPLMFFAAQGERLSSEEWDPLRLSLISIANVGNSTTFGNYTLSVGSTTYSARWISNLFSVIDILYSACIVLLMVVLQRTISYVRLKVGSSSLSASEYAIYVDGIPRDVTEEELREHFSNLYNLHAADWVYASHWRACWCGRKTLQRHKFAPAINAPQAKARINLDKPMPASTMLDVYLPPGSVGFTSSGAGDADAVFSAIQPPEGMLALHATHGSLRPTLDADVTPVQGACAPRARARARGCSRPHRVLPVSGTRAVLTQLSTHTRTHPPADTRNSGDDAYLNTWVGEVSLATANGTLIRRYQALAGLFRRIRLARAAVRKYSVGSPYAHEKRRAHALKSLAAIEARLEFIDKKYSQEFSTDTVAAYVVFNCEESLTRCVADYRGSANVCSPAYWCQPRPLRLRQGKHHIRVSRAPDPSQIIWQNLELTPRARLLRQVGTGFLVALLLVVSLFFIMLAQGYQQRFRATMPNLNSCGTLLPALAFGKQVTSDGVLDETIANNTLPEPLVLMRNNSDATCAAQGLTRIHWTAPSHPGVPILTSPTSTDPCYNDCFSSDSSGSCALNTTTPGTALSVPRQLTVTCYCVSRLRTLLDQKGVFDAANTLYREDRDMCTSSATVRALRAHLPAVRACCTCVLHACCACPCDADAELFGVQRVYSACVGHRGVHQLDAHHHPARGDEHGGAHEH
ncbi:RNA-binding protein [archaeon]|nr:MAG: RNA-binding protein [archaeon]